MSAAELASTYLSSVEGDGREECRSGESVSHTPSKRYSCSIRREEVDEVMHIRPGSLPVQVCALRVGRGAQLGINELVERNGERCGVVVVVVACGARSIGGKSLSVSVYETVLM